MLKDVRTRALLCALLFTWAAAARAEETNGLLAVLPLNAPRLDKDLRDTLEEDIRTVAGNYLSPYGYTVLTGDNTLAVLADNGVDPSKACEATCALQAARELKANLFVSGSATQAEGEYVAFVRLFESKSGRQLRSVKLEGAKVKILRQQFEEKAEDLFRPITGGTRAPAPAAAPVAPPAPTPAPRTAAKGFLKIVTDPAGASVSIDGEGAGTTPLRREVDAGSYRVKVSLAGYKDLTNTVAVNAGEEGFWSESLTASPGAVRKEPKTGLEFVYLPGGTFHFGCEPQDKGCDDDEKPGRSVSVAPFWIGRTHVTVDAYARCVKAGVCEATTFETKTCNWSRRGSHPMNCVSLAEARTFCEWIGGKLPHAEEWEYAAKSGESRIFPWGDAAVTGALANYCDKNCPDALPTEEKDKLISGKLIDFDQDDGFSGTAPVGSYPAGATRWGLLDMAGNALHWTEDKLDPTHQEVRGGAWNNIPRFIRASFRNKENATSHVYNLGFRCLQ